MRTALRWVVVVVATVHGLIHLLGAAKGLGWARVTQLREPISVTLGVVWLSAAVLVVAAGILLGFGVRWWWMVGAFAVVVSQGVILTSWGADGRASS